PVLVDCSRGPSSCKAFSGGLDYVCHPVGIENDVQFEPKFRAHHFTSSLVTPESAACQRYHHPEGSTGGDMVFGMDRPATTLFCKKRGLAFNGDDCPRCPAGRAGPGER